jgi:hypothetical protein
MNAVDERGRHPHDDSGCGSGGGASGAAYRDEEALHQRVSQDRRAKSWLPTATRRKIENGVRVALTTCIVIISMKYYAWSATLTYISPTLAPTVTVLYFGHWLENMWKITYSTVLCTIAGSLIGLASHNPTLLIILLIISLVAVNKCSVWDRLCKVLGGLCIIVAALFPILSHWKYSLHNLIVMIMLMNLIPSFAAGVGLLVAPYPALAFGLVQTKITKICRKFSAALFALTRSFCSSDHVDMLNTEVEFLLTEVEGILDELDPLLRYAAIESAFLGSLTDLVQSGKQLVTLSRKLLEELHWMRVALQELTVNRTQATFVRHLELQLKDICDEVDLMFGIVATHIMIMSVCPAWVRYIIPHHVLGSCRDWLRQFSWGDDSHTRTADEDEWRRQVHQHRARAATRTYSLQHDSVPTMMVEMRTLDHYSPKPGKKSANAINGPNLPDIEAQFDDESEALQDFTAAQARLEEATDLLIINFQTTRNHFWSRTQKVVSSRHLVDSSTHSKEFASVVNAPKSENTWDSDLNPHGDYVSSEEEDSVSQILYEENSRLAVENFGPRSSFLSRIIVVKSIVAGMRAILKRKNKHVQKQSSRMPSLLTFSWSVIRFVIAYVADLPNECASLFGALWFFVFGRISDVHLEVQTTPPESSHIMETEGIVYKAKSANSVAGPLSEKVRLEKFLEVRRLHIKKLKSYVQPLKISAAITITSIFVIFPQIGHNSYLFTSNALWATVVIALVRQDSTASSFLQSYQRIEGKRILVCLILSIPILMLPLKLSAFITPRRHPHRSALCFCSVLLFGLC